MLEHVATSPSQEPSPFEEELSTHSVQAVSAKHSPATAVVVYKTARGIHASELIKRIRARRRGFSSECRKCQAAAVQHVDWTRCPDVSGRSSTNNRLFGYVWKHQRPQRQHQTPPLQYEQISVSIRRRRKFDLDRDTCRGDIHACLEVYIHCISILMILIKIVTRVH